jgi:methanogenic corrinoid protein MtbC1
MAGEKRALMGNAGFGALDIDVYERNKSNIHRLRDHLPEDLVANLAREVIRRVVSKADTIEAEIEAPNAEDLEQLAHALIDTDDAIAPQLILGLRTGGKGAEAIYIAHLAAAARLLGDWWEEDRVRFSQVTLATGRIFAIMRGMKHMFEPVALVEGKSALFASVPGEDHTLGIRMAADLFRKEGWDITVKTGLDHDALVEQIEQTPARILGLSMSGKHSFEALSRLVLAVRISAPHLSIFLSGQSVDENMHLLELMEFDGISSDVEDAKERLSELWADSISR